MTTPTATTAPAATQATAGATTTAGANGAAASPAAGSLFTTLLASIGGPVLADATGAAVADGLPADLGAEAEQAAPAETAALVPEAPVVPPVVLVPVPAPVAAAPAVPAGEPIAGDAAAAAAVLAIPGGEGDPAVAVPVAPAALLAVADAMPEQAAPPDDAPARPAIADDGTGAMPLPQGVAADDGPAPVAVPVANAAPAPSTPPPASAAPETAVKAATGRRPAEGEDAPAPVTAAREGQPPAPLANVSVEGAQHTAPAESPAAVPGFDRERFERLVDGLAARLRVSLAGDGARVRMHLTPRELGEVIVRLELKDGLAQAHLIAESREASRMLTAAMGDLRTALADRGIQVDRLDVRVSGEAGSPAHGHGQAQHGQHPGSGERRARLPFSLDPLGALPSASTTTGIPEESTTRSGVSVLA